VVVSPDVVEVLLAHRQRQEAERQYLADAWPATGLVFVSEVGTAVNPDNLKRLKDALMDKAGVPRVRLHDLRHLHASIAIKNGADPKLLADRLGHSRASFTMDRYTHLFESQRADGAVSLLDFLPPPSAPN
jgi:integrase